jgi:hypothetical protein
MKVLREFYRDAKRAALTTLNAGMPLYKFNPALLRLTIQFFTNTNTNK